MAKLTRKVWVGIGAATIATASVATGAVAQHSGHGAPDQGDQPADEAAAKNPAEGGEAYLTDGGPRDTRIRFYRDIGLVRGHLMIGSQLIELDMWDEAVPHFLHPSEELYALMEKYIKGHNIRPFKLELAVLAQAVQAKRRSAYEQALKVVDQRLTGALDKAKEFMNPPLGFTARTAAEMLKVALSEYEASMEDGRFTKPVEYQDSRGFVLQADLWIEGVAGQLQKADADALAKVRAAMKKLKTAWPTPMPPPEPILDAGVISALVSEVELHTSGY